MGYIPDPGWTMVNLSICILYGAWIYAWFIPKRKDGHTWDFMNDQFFAMVFIGILAVAICEMLIVSSGTLIQDVIRTGCSICT